jgi:beta-lactamase regulating signal transducer with metallopeptidase domain
MEDILYYLLKVSIGTAVFYLTYHFLFRKSKQFVFNRLYLAGSFLASFIIPLITFKRKTYITEAAYSYITSETIVTSETMTYVQDTAVSMGVHQYLLIIYFAGVVYFLARLAYAFIVAARIKANSTTENIAGMNINISGKNIRAFTFLDRIVIGREILGHPSLNMVLVHEAVHSKEKHFVDILTAELLFMLQWFNPFAWLKRMAIRNNLEFRADDVVARSFDPLEYQLAMLSMAQKSVKSPLLIELNSSNLKKRIIMMKSNRHTRFSGFARMAIIPVTAILLLSLSGKETVIIRNTENVASQIENNFLQPEENIASTIIIMQDKLGTVDSLRQFIAENLRYPQEAAEAGQTGHVSLFVSIDSDGKITEINTSEPSDGYIDINEIVIVGYGKPRDGLSENEIELEDSSEHETLITEGKRVINSFPELNIPELKGKNAKFNFQFVLQPAVSKETSQENKQQDATQVGSTAPTKRRWAGTHGQLLPMTITWPRHSRELANLDEIRKYLQYYLGYPMSAAGNLGSVEIYARINNEGWVENASERKLSTNYIDLGEPAVFGGFEGARTRRRTFTSEPELVQEGKNLLMSLPRIDMPELHGKTIKATLSW